MGRQQHFGQSAWHEQPAVIGHDTHSLPATPEQREHVVDDSLISFSIC